MEYADELCPGLQLRVTARRKVWSVINRRNGRLRRVTIGQYPQVNVAGARATARQILIRADADWSAIAERPMAVQSITYRELVDQYFERHLKPNTRSGRDIRANLLHVRLQPHFGRPAATITKADIIAVLDGMVAAGTRQAAVNTLRRLKMLFNWAVDRDLLSGSPCDRIRPPAKTAERDRVLLDHEIAAIWCGSFELPPPFGALIRTLLLTGQRRTEVATMQWGEVANGLWTIPREKVKKDRPHAVPLSQPAVAIIRGLPRFVGGDFVFTTTGGQRPVSGFSKAKKRLDQLSGVTDWRIHDIRRTVRSKLAELRVPREIARKILNHEDGKVDRIYNRHEYLDEKREALEKWAEHLLALVGH